MKKLLIIGLVLLSTNLFAQNVTASLNGDVKMAKGSLQYTWSLSAPLDVLITSMDFAKGIKVSGVTADGKTVKISTMPATANVSSDWKTIVVNIPLMAPPKDLASVSITVPSVKACKATDKKQAEVTVSGTGGSVSGKV